MFRRCKALVKGTACRAAVLLGAPKARLRQLSNQLLVLTYHSFVERQTDSLVNRMPMHTIEQQLGFLRGNTRLVSLSQGLELLETEKAGPRPPRGPCVAITVDDGFEDNYTLLYPLLKRWSVPATIFVATDFIETGRPPWPTELCEILDQARRAVTGPPDHLPLGTRSQKVQAMGQLMTRFKTLPPPARHEALDDLRSRLAAPPGWRSRPLTWPQLREMRQSGWEVGSHSAFHSMMPWAEPSVRRAELVDSRTAIEARLGTACALFSYPNGDWTREIAREVAAAGYTAAVSQDWGANVAGEDRFALKRIEVPFDERLPVFSCRLSLLLKPRGAGPASGRG